MITSWNSGAERIYGYSAEEVVGRSISVIVPADRSGEVPDILRRIRRKESITHYETEQIRKDGSRVDVSITVSPIITPAGDVVGASAIARDISEKKQLQATKDSFISTVSHELRTPLTSIRGYLEALIEDEGGPLNAEQQEYADIAYRNTGRLQKIVEDLLLLPRLDLGQLELNSAVINVGGVLRQVEQEFSLVAQEKNIALLIRAESDLVIIGDRFRIAQVMSNLVGNALKFTPSGRRVSVSASRWHDEVIVEVVDEGVGIPAAELPRLTERFFRASTAGSVQGTGLGLAITKDIIERHGGKLEIESEEGVGSTFRVVLPEASQGQSRV
jgi:PAS domain S-box-containing protein